MADESELLPCPFCGGAGTSGEIPHCEGHFFAGCADPDCIAFHDAFDFVSEATAIAAWNRRPAPAGIAPNGVSSDVASFAITVEKMLCEALGRPWTVTGMSIETLCAEVAALSAQSPNTAPKSGEEPEGWRPIDDEAKQGQRILLLWKPLGGLSEHVELGWHTLGQWVNTYGKPFNNAPDAWAPLAPFRSEWQDGFLPEDFAAALVPRHRSGLSGMAFMAGQVHAPAV